MTVTLHNAACGTELSFYISQECAIEAARKRRRLYGRDSEVRDDDGAVVYSTVGQQETEFADPISALFRRIEGGHGRVFGSEHSTLNFRQQGIQR